VGWKCSNYQRERERERERERGNSNFTTLHLLFQSFMAIREQYVLMAWLLCVFEGVDGKMILV